MSKCCIYCRIAGEPTEANRAAMEAQTAALWSAAQKLGLEIVEERFCYEPAHDPKRESISRLLKDAEAGAFDAVLVKNPNRLARDTYCMEEIVTAFRQAGLKVFTPEGELQFTAPRVAAYFRVASLSQIIGERDLDEAAERLEAKGYNSNEAAELATQCYSDMQSDGYQKPIEWYLKNVAEKEVPEMSGMLIVHL